jgi:Cu-Zn family superoxide dismutase
MEKASGWRPREVSGGVVIDVDVKGITPGLHAVHVHAIGKCEGPAFTSAGGHFNPAQKKHGLRSAEGPHAGDMPNMYCQRRYRAVRSFGG